MSIKIAGAFTASALGTLLAFGLSGTRAAETAKRFAADKGPKTVDVAKYPKAAQDIYEGAFTKRCGKCHTLARPINTDFSPGKWEGYVKKMMRKPGSGMKPDEAKKIWQFLVFDTKQRKPAFWGKLPESERAVGEKIEKELGGS